MKPPAGLCISAIFIALSVYLTCNFPIVLYIVPKVILIDKIIAGIIGRVNINHFYLAIIGFLQKLQNFKIISLNVEIFRIIPILAFFPAGPQGSHRWGLGQSQRFPLAIPFEAILFLGIIHKISQKLTQYIKIYFPLLKSLRKKLLHSLDIFCCYIHRFTI